MTGNLIIGNASKAMSLTLSDIVGSAWQLNTSNTNLSFNNNLGGFLHLQ
jgi:hypothetical protein